jgi:Flp pilus assembly protein TadD
VALLPEYLTAVSMPALRAGLSDGDALVRANAVRALAPLPPEQRARAAAPLLADPVRGVRIEVARLLAGTPPELLSPADHAALDRGVAELIAAELVSAERPESHGNVATVYAQLGRMDDAERELNIALRLDPRFVPAMVNLADLNRAQQRDDLARFWLQTAITLAPDAAEPVHALGLLEVRQKRPAEALPLLARAAALQPQNVRYAYVYAVALHSGGEVDKSIAVLTAAHDRRPADREVLSALIAFEREKGDLRSAVAHAKQLTQLAPRDPNAVALLGELLRPH